MDANRPGGELTCDVTIEAPAARVYEALTTAGALSHWWGRPVESELSVGSIADLPLGAACLMRIRIDELERPSRVRWTCIGGVPEWERSSLRFELEQQLCTTLLRFVHRDWRWRVPGGELAASGFSWPRHLLRIRTLARMPRGCDRVRPARS